MMSVARNPFQKLMYFLVYSFCICNICVLHAISVLFYAREIASKASDETCFVFIFVGRTSVRKILRTDYRRLPVHLPCFGRTFLRGTQLDDKICQINSCCSAKLRHVSAYRKMFHWTTRNNSYFFNILNIFIQMQFPILLKGALVCQDIIHVCGMNTFIFNIR